MSAKYPIISVTGSSGAGTTSVRRTFEQIFRREHIEAAYIEGDAFQRYNRDQMRAVMAEEESKGNRLFSHFGESANLLAELEDAFRSYGESGTGKTRHYVTDWAALPEKSELLFYEGLHGAVKTDKVNIAQYPDLKIGVVPVINLEWIQKIHQDRSVRGYTREEIMDTMLRRMPDYVHYICPQFTETDINFQRVPTVDTSNPFAARWIPTADESLVVIRFVKPRGIDFPICIR